ncbi:MAG: methyltransferase [Deltaproteobacteria bacterium]|nr:methyltransferase [Deltaproteobacteria bacterium]
MADLTPKERVMGLLKREPIDTMPIFSGLSMLVKPALDEAGYGFSSIHTDHERMAWAAIRSSKMMEFDCIVVPFDITMQSEALGNRVNFYENTSDIVFPTIPEKIWKSLDEVEVPEDILERGRHYLVARAIEMIKNEAPEYPLGVWLRGPFTQLGQILELEVVLKAAFKQKEKIVEVLDKLTAMAIRIGKAWQDAGADYITLSEPGSNAEILPPRMFSQLVQPRLTRILDSWESPKILHISGATDSLVEMMNQCGADAIGVDIKNNLKETRAKIGPDVLLFGNFDVYELPCRAETSVDQAVDAIRENIDAGVDGVWPGSDLWPDVKLENMQAIVKTVHEYGKKPSPVIGRIIQKPFPP